MVEGQPILERLLRDRTLLRRALLAGGQGNVLQIGKYNIRIEQGENLQIGDRVYQGPDLETLRQVVREVQADIAADHYAASLQDYFRALRAYCASLPYLTLTGIRPPKNLDEVYVPLQARRRGGGQGQKMAAQGPSLSIAEVLRQTQTHLLILGQPGAGKSTLLRQLAERAYDDPQSIGLKRPHLPLLLPLRALARTEGALEERLNRALRNELSPHLTRALPDGFFDAWPQQLDAPWLFLLDGLDEVPGGDYLSLKAWLEGLLARSEIARLIITSRPFADAETERGDSRFGVYEIQPFTPKQTAELTRRWFGDNAPAFLEALKNVRSGVLEQTPLLLTVAAKVYLERGRLPERRARLYQEFVDILLEEARQRGLGNELDAAVLDLAQPTLAQIALVMTDHLGWMDEASLTLVVAQYLDKQLNLKDRAKTVARRFLRVMARRSGVFLRTEYRLIHFSQHGAPINSTQTKEFPCFWRTYGWLHPTFCEYFAAQALNQALESGGSFDQVLGERCFQWRWDDTIVTLAEMHSQPVKLVTWLISQGSKRGISHTVFLAHQCWNKIRNAVNNQTHSVVIEAFITTLNSPDENVRWAAMSALEKVLRPTDENIIEPLMVMLCDSMDISEIAAKALAKLDGVRVIEKLAVAAVRGPYTYVRMHAADALGRSGELRAVNPLILALRDFHPEVRWHAARALVKIGKPAVEPLIDALGSPEINVRRGAAYALGEIGDIRAVQPLIAALRDEEADIRYTAAEALGKLGDPHALPELELLLNDKTHVPILSTVASAAHKAIARIRERMSQTGQSGEA